MVTIESNWKSKIFCQLKEHNCQSKAYENIIEHYNRILENNTILQVQCIKLEKDVYHLRLANTDLERTVEGSQEVVIINNKLSEANEEVVRHLREKGELAREVVRLNHALTDVNEKFIREEIKAQ
ncbi:unnamed protein product [Rotaria sp. Silwood2]|nr:unnamed protein product [Rotaria sp. Silwood2]